ncbi:MAG: PKD domain-containing protein [Bacteroidales bacterium]|nr:PKD domain-containing protein [Bacteroidales bacterium]
MKKFAFILMAAAALFTACAEGEGGTSGGGSSLAVKADFTMSATQVLVGEEVTFTATAEGGVSPYTFNWQLGTSVNLSGQTVKYTFDNNGGVIVKLTVLDKDGNKAEKRKNLIVNPRPVAEQGQVNLLWAAKIQGYNAISTPAIADDGSVYATSQAGILYKFDKNGNQLWTKETGLGIKGTPSIDTDGTVFLGAGSSNGTAKVYAFNPDGTIKWEFTEFWAAPGATLSASMLGSVCGIGATNIYFGNCGTTGTVIAVNKTTGQRVGYVVNDAEGTAGPTGGARAGVTISKNGYIHWGGGQYGVHGIAQSKIDGAGNSGVKWDWRYYQVKGKNNAEGPIALAKVNGKTCVVGVQTSNDTGIPWVYAVDAAAPAGYPKAESEYIVPGTTGEMDNGSVAVTAEGYIVATLNYTNGKEDGGIIVVNPSTNPGTLVAEYRIMEKVSGAPAIDAAGNIHFGTESGNYYVVKIVDGKCELVAKKDLAALVLADSRYAETIPFDSPAKVYSSVVIGDDGRVYLQFTNNDAGRVREFGALVCLEVGGCTAPGNTDWPMMGQNRRHTNCEK